MGASLTFGLLGSNRAVPSLTFGLLGSNRAVPSLTFGLLGSVVLLEPSLMLILL